MACEKELADDKNLLTKECTKCATSFNYNKFFYAHFFHSLPSHCKDCRENKGRVFTEAQKEENRKKFKKASKPKDSGEKIEVTKDQLRMLLGKFDGAFTLAGDSSESSNKEKMTIDAAGLRALLEEL